MKLSVAVAVALVVTATMVGACAGGNGGGASTESVEYKLAVIDRGGNLDTDDPLVGQFRSVLDALVEKCSDSRQRIADMGVTAQGLLQDKGVDVGLIRVMQDVDRSIPSGLGEQPCADVFASYVTLQ